VQRRVDYAGPLCGRPVGFWQEGGTRVLCTQGPDIIDAKQGEATVGRFSPVERQVLHAALRQMEEKRETLRNLPSQEPFVVRRELILI
jgi:hypothetical protein